MTRDPNQQHPADPDPCAGTSEAERQAKSTQLTPSGSKPSTQEAALLHQRFPGIFAEHHELVWDYLRRRVRSRDDAKDLQQEVFLTLHTYILAKGYPDNIAGMLKRFCKGKLSNYNQAKDCLPPLVSPPSSTSEKPTSAPDLPRAMDLRELAKRVWPHLSPEQKEVVQKVFLDGLSHREAAEALGLTEGQLKARVVAARRVMRALAEPFVPLSQREAL